MTSRGIPLGTQEIILNSWRKSTKSQYKVYFKKWQEFCARAGEDPLSPSTRVLLDYLTALYDSGLGFSALNTARSAISSLGTLADGSQLGDKPIIKRFFRGVYNVRPSRPRYSSTWDVNQVLDYIKTEWGEKAIPLKFLSYKLLMLVALVTGQRGQSFHLMNLEYMIDSTQSVEFSIAEHTKTSRPGARQTVLVLPAYPDDIRICVVSTLRAYLSRTNDLRLGEDKQLFISFVKPHKPVSRDTISRWVKGTLALAGIDIKMFKAHSTRAAATTAALRCKVPMDTILRTAGWSNAGTFATYYNKEIQDNTQFGKSLLKNCS